jgi:hypothetical protein
MINQLLFIIIIIIWIKDNLSLYTLRIIYGNWFIFTISAVASSWSWKLIWSNNWVKVWSRTGIRWMMKNYFFNNFIRSFWIFSWVFFRSNLIRRIIILLRNHCLFLCLNLLLLLLLWWLLLLLLLICLNLLLRLVDLIFKVSSNLLLFHLFRLIADLLLLLLLLALSRLFGTIKFINFLFDFIESIFKETPYLICYFFNLFLCFFSKLFFVLLLYIRSFILITLNCRHTRLLSILLLLTWSSRLILLYRLSRSRGWDLGLSFSLILRLCWWGWRALVCTFTFL